MTTSTPGENQPVTAADMAAIFTGPVEGRDYDEMPDAEAPTMTMAELRQALRGPDRLLTDDECHIVLVWLLSYSAEYGSHSRGREIHRALALAVKSQLDARSGGAK